MAETSTVVLTGLAGVLSGMVKAKGAKIAKEAEAAKKKSQDIKDKQLILQNQAKTFENSLMQIRAQENREKTKLDQQNIQSQIELRGAKQQESETFQGMLQRGPAAQDEQTPQAGGAGQFQLESITRGGAKFVNPAVKGQVAGQVAASKPLGSEEIRNRSLTNSIIRQGGEAIALLKGHPEFGGAQAALTSGLRRKAGGPGIGRLIKAGLGLINEKEMTPEEATFLAAMDDIMDKAVLIRSGVAVRTEERESEKRKMGLGAAIHLLPILLNRYIEQAILDGKYRIELQKQSRTGGTLGETSKKKDPLGIR